MLLHTLAITFAVTGIVVMAAPVSHELAHPIHIEHIRTQSAGHSGSSSHSSELPPSHSMQSQSTYPVDTEASTSFSMSAEKPVKELDLLSALKTTGKNTVRIRTYRERYLERKRLGIAGNGKRGPPPAVLDPSDPDYKWKVKKQESNRRQTQRLKGVKKERKKEEVNRLNLTLAPLDASTSRSSSQSSGKTRKPRYRPPRSTLDPKQLLNVRESEKIQKRKYRASKKSSASDTATTSGQ